MCELKDLESLIGSYAQSNCMVIEKQTANDGKINQIEWQVVFSAIYVVNAHVIILSKSDAQEDFSFDIHA